MAHERGLVVLEVLDPPDGTTKYVDQVVSDLPDWVEVRYFSWLRGLLGRHDVLHVHWPEHLTRGASRWATTVKRVLFLLLLVRERLLRVAVVRTEHNLGPHEPGDRFEEHLLSWLERSATTTIQLNRSGPRHAGEAVLVPHGDYRRPFARHRRRPTVPGRIVYAGLIRDYKGVDRLLDAFAQLPGDDLELRVVGRPATSEWRRRVEDACVRDPRTSALLEYVPDAVLVEEVTAAELVVLPYTEMHNSGAVFVALSLDRPVLVPRTPVNVELANEVGDGWLLLFDGPLTSATLAEALAAVRRPGRGPTPALEGRDWTTVAQRHADVYLRAARRHGRFTRMPRPTSGGVAPSV